MPAVSNPSVRFEHYRDKYRDAALRREGGVLEVRFHTDGGPYRMNGTSHAEMPDLFWNIAADHENKVVILTGTGDRFSTGIDPDFELSSGEAVAKVHWEGQRLMRNLADIEVPVITALNGPLTMNMFPMIADIILCEEHTVFQDPHVLYGTAAGDGAQAIWSHLIGPVRSAYFLLTGQIIDAQEARALGVVNEVLPQGGALDRAWEIAREMALRPMTALRYTRAATASEWRRLLQDLPATYALQNLGTQTTRDPEWEAEMARRNSGE